MKLAVIGGCGHVGLPLGIALASRGAEVTLLDIDETAVATVNAGVMPFKEEGAGSVLEQVVSDGSLRATTVASSLADSDVVIVVIGTPVDEHLNPDPNAIPIALEPILPHLRDGQLMVLRSTIYPGVTRLVEEALQQAGLAVDVAFCPERIAEGKAMTELFALPQIVAARTESIRKQAAEVFGLLTDDIVYLEPEEAELAKLFTNTWRYIKFATANQLFMMANDFGVDFERVRHAVTWNYPRAADMPSAGFAAGPCLFKDTMQLAAFNNNNFALGHAAMLVNEGLPLYLVSKLEEQFPLTTMTVGILGMAFKGGSDDIRSSLSYKLKRILRFKAAGVVTTDPYVEVDDDLLPLEAVLEQADLLIVGAPHPEYRTLTTDLPVIDIWNLNDRGVLI